MPAPSIYSSIVSRLGQQLSTSPAFRTWAKFLYNKSYFPSIGLRRDDTLCETPDVEEAINRMPKYLQDERAFRICRALDLSNKKIMLPREEWTKFEEDERYMLPYLEQVWKEQTEQSQWKRL
eukprot:GHVU01179870.1.p1 GENE.GHVU01179870.1~~GHVU01179870.1.p1  ORF type:complete len:137 (+),score=7.33 GHVU01179870.1:48-413(+)